MIDPEKVTAGGFEVLTVLSNSGEGGYSVARVRKHGQEHIGIRWNGEAGEKGYPTARGHAVWFSLPKSVGLVLNAHYRAIQTADEERRPTSEYD